MQQTLNEYHPNFFSITRKFDTDGRLPYVNLPGSIEYEIDLHTQLFCSQELCKIFPLHAEKIEQSRINFVRQMLIVIQNKYQLSQRINLWSYVEIIICSYVGALCRICGEEAFIYALESCRMVQELKAYDGIEIDIRQKVFQFLKRP